MQHKKYYALKKKYDPVNIRAFIDQFFDDNLLEYIIKHKSSFYKTFKIPKKRDGFREINQPIKQLMWIQKEISNFLLIKRMNNDFSHGFELKRSIITNAKKHTNKKMVLNIDLKNFFSTITKSKVSELFVNYFDLSKFEANHIAEILTYKDCLPQGAPSSPVISNYACMELDDHLSKYCKKKNIEYTRYADDMTFSSDSDRLNFGQLKSIILIIEKHGFKVNVKKIRHYYQNSRQLVTGLVVNEKVNVKREFYKKLRAILHSWDTKGIDHTKAVFYENQERKKGASFVSTIEGWINYLGQVKGFNHPNYKKLNTKFRELNSSKLK